MISPIVLPPSWVRILIVNFFFCSMLYPSTLIPHLTPTQAEQIGKRIWQNECAGRIDQLTFWNKNEPFSSLGIGHFIWFPQDYHGPYTQMFPLVIAYLKKNKIIIPQWIQKSIFCPWKNRNVFYQQFDTKKMQELRDLLSSTVALQAQFIIQNFEKSLKTMVKTVARNERKKIKQRLSAIAQSSGGLYALIDYKNFKGSGTNQKESYCGHRWGLLQVLQNMDIHTQPPCKAFVDSAKKVLEKRVALAPLEKPEKQFLAGWVKRLNTYLT